MKLRKGLLVFCLLVTLPLFVMAQEGSRANITGNFVTEGTLGDEATRSEDSIRALGPVYEWTFTYEGEEEETSTVLRHGNLLIEGYGDASCNEGYYMRQNNGTLFGLWTSGDGDALGIEVLTPSTMTEGFAGRYSMVGNSPDGVRYEGYAHISQTDDGFFEITFTYTYDDNADDDDLPFSTHAVAMARDNILGFAYTDDPDVRCGIYIARFSDDGSSFEAEYIEPDGTIGSEVGLREGNDD